MHSNLMNGTTIYAADGKELGTVKEIRGAYFKVDQLDYAKPAVILAGAGTYRFSRIAGVSCGVQGPTVASAETTVASAQSSGPGPACGSSAGPTPRPRAACPRSASWSRGERLAQCSSFASRQCTFSARARWCGPTFGTPPSTSIRRRCPAPAKCWRA